jgi:hypothetical protein
MFAVARHEFPATKAESGLRGTLFARKNRKVAMFRLVLFCLTPFVVFAQDASLSPEENRGHHDQPDCG